MQTNVQSPRQHKRRGMAWEEYMQEPTNLPAQYVVFVHVCQTISGTFNVVYIYEKQLVAMKLW